MYIVTNKIIYFYNGWRLEMFSATYLNNILCSRCCFAEGYIKAKRFYIKAKRFTFLNEIHKEKILMSFEINLTLTRYIELFFVKI